MLQIGGLTYSSNGIGPIGGKRFGCIGDSYTAYAYYASATENSSQNNSYIAWLRDYSKGRLSLSRSDIYAASGTTTSTMVANGYHTSAAAARLDFVVICAGSNDPFASNPTISYSTTIANLTTMYNAVLASGAIVVAIGIPTRNSLVAAAAKHFSRVNSWIQAQARQNPRILYINPVGRVADPSNGDYVSGYNVTGDNTHLGVAGAQVYGEAIWDMMAPFCPAYSNCFDFFHDTLDATDNPRGNLLTNGLQVGTGGTEGTTAGVGTVTGDTSTGYTLDCSGTAAGISVVGSKVARTDGIQGHWQQAVVSGTAGDINNFYVFLGQTPGTTGVNAGDTLRGWAEMELDTGFTNVEAMGILAYFAGATYLSYSQFYVAEGRGVLVDRGSKISIIAQTHEITVPSGVTGLRFRPFIKFTRNATAAATWRVGRCAFRNITGT